MLTFGLKTVAGHDRDQTRRLLVYAVRPSAFQTAIEWSWREVRHAFFMSATAHCQDTPPLISSILSWPRTMSHPPDDIALLTPRVFHRYLSHSPLLLSLYTF